MRTLAEKRRLGLVVAGLVHRAYVQGNADGVDRAYASCQYSEFLRDATPMPVVSNEHVELPVNCMRCVIGKHVLFDDDVLELLEQRKMVPAAKLMCERGFTLPVVKEAVFNWQAEVDADLDG